MKTIIITEKPSVARDYASILLNRSNKQTGFIEGHSELLNKDVIITWAVGHLVLLGSVDEQREQKIVKKTDEYKWNQTELPIIPQTWFYKPSFQTLDQYKIIKTLYKSSDVEEIIYAGDSGREGIYIQALIRNLIFGDGTIENAHVPSRITESVVWIDSQTEDEIRRGIRERKPYHSFDTMIAAGYERAKRDWLMGMNFSRAYTIKTNVLIAAGRVMSPTLNMIVSRQEEIDNFVPTFYYGIKANMETYNPIWKTDKDSKYFESELMYNDSGFLKKEDADKLLNELSTDNHLTISDVSISEKKEYAPFLYNLADLQEECSKLFHISPTETLQIAQSLYEKRMTTYPRTDARVLTTSVANELSLKGYHIPAKYINNSKVTDHYAIIPTFQKSTFSSELEEKVYLLIYKRFIAITKPPYIYDAVKLRFSHQNGEHFYMDGRVDKSLGYKELYTNELITFPIPTKGTVYPVNAFELNEGQTKPPVAYTTGTLIKAMEKAGRTIEDEELREQIKTCGIGTSATRDNIITKLQKNQYINVDKKQKVSPTELGKQIITIMKTIDTTFINPEKTAEMEAELNEISEGNISLENAFINTKFYITDIVAQIQNGQFNKIAHPTSKGKETHNSFTCPYCNGELVNGLYGYWCKTNKDFKSFGGHKLTETDVKAIITKGKTKAYHLTFQSGKTAKASIIKGENGNELEYER